MSVDPPVMEFIGATRGTSRGAWVVAPLLAACVAAGGLFLWWNDSVQHRADESLAAAVADAENRTRVGEARVLSTLAYASPMIWSESVPEGVRVDLRALVQASAAEAAVDLARVGSAAASTTVLPWHGEQERTRAQVLVLVDRLRLRFEAVAADARAIGDVFSRPAPTGASLVD